jgi:uncharacterized protein DUF955
MSLAPSPKALARGLSTFVGMQPPVDLAEVAKRIGLRWKEVNSTGFDGALVRIADRPQGLVATRETIDGEGRKRFTIAHEIGHYLLSGHGVDTSVCTKEGIGVLRNYVDRMENEANEFASELLLPSRTVAAIVAEYGVSLETSRFVAQQFKASLTASAVKCVETSNAKAALVVTEDGVIKYFRRGGRWKYYIKQGNELFSGSLAKDPWPEGVFEKRGKVSGLAWTHVQVCPDLWEESILMPLYDRILTLLTVV